MEALAMSQLVPYIRNVDGSIIRIESGIYQSSSDRLYPYLFEEHLTGWPEPKVYWSKQSGPCVGIAPYTGDLNPLSNIAKADEQ
jgi:hypothetical protein